MNLQPLIEQYIAYRPALGEKFKANATVLRAFGRAIGARADVAEVRPPQVSTFLASAGPITSALRGFYRYATCRGHVGASPLPDVLPKQPPRFVPYIYSRADLRRLLDATDACARGRGCLGLATVRALLLLLYGAGLRVSETVALERTDVELENSWLTVRQTKFYKTRLVPFGPQL